MNAEAVGTPNTANFTADEYNARMAYWARTATPAAARKALPAFLDFERKAAQIVPGIRILLEPERLMIEQIRAGNKVINGRKHTPAEKQCVREQCDDLALDVLLALRHEILVAPLMAMLPDSVRRMVEGN